MKTRRKTETSPTTNTGEETGHVMILLIGYVLISLLVVTVVAAAGSIYLGHKKLLSIADGAALAAADYLAGIGSPEGLGNIVLDSATGVGDGRTAVVGVSAVVHPLFINFLVPEGISISVSSTARANLVL